MIKIAGLSVPLSFDMQMVETLAAERLHIDRQVIRTIKIIRQDVDCSDKKDVHFNLAVGLEIKGDECPVVWQCHDKSITLEEEIVYVAVKKRESPFFLKQVNSFMKTDIKKDRPVVIGFGPAGIFAALILAQSGADPIVLERGLDVDSRKNSIETFFQSGILDLNSNVQFGEGGAGTFSDGKLKIGKPDPYKTKVIQEFIKAGAPDEITYLAKPHIGTDRLSEIVKAMRKEIIALGGEIHFNAVVTEVLHQDGALTGIRYIDQNENDQNKRDRNELHELSTRHAVLAIGHSARDTYSQLLECNVAMKQKSIAVGIRIEHPQHLIDTIQYGASAGHEKLGAADYRMVVHLPNGRGVYTFCMCPGGSVIAATSDWNGVVTNGMSRYARSGENANTALLVTVDKNEFRSPHPLAGCEFQRAIEKKAFIAGGGGYKAPVQRLEDFMKKKGTMSFGEVSPTYQPGTSFAEVDSYLPPDIAESLRQAIVEMDAWMPGFAFPDALMTGAETRSSSAVYIQREEDLQAAGFRGLYPCGEGAGYSGGIISAAVDGIRCAERILIDNHGV